jgi:hypothetical protein
MMVGDCGRAQRRIAQEYSGKSKPKLRFSPF